MQDITEGTITGVMKQSPVEIEAKSGTKYIKLLVDATKKNRKREFVPVTYEITAFSRVADYCRNALTRGTKVKVDVELTSNEFKKEGSTRYFAGYTAQSVEALNEVRPTSEAPKTVMDEQEDIPF